MKKILMTGFAAVALCGTPVLATDMPVRPPVYKAAPAPAFNWSGFYVGGNAGYAWHDPTVTFTPNDAASSAGTCGGLFGGTCPPPASFNIHGGLGGCVRIMFCRA